MKKIAVRSALPFLVPGDTAVPFLCSLWVSTPSPYAQRFHSTTLPSTLHHTTPRYEIPREAGFPAQAGLGSHCGLPCNAALHQKVHCHLLADSMLRYSVGTRRLASPSAQKHPALYQACQRDTSFLPQNPILCHIARTPATPMG
jgi:hypothetical protein